MNAIAEGIGSLLDVSVLLYMLIGLLLGFLVGAFPGITATDLMEANGITAAIKPGQTIRIPQRP